MQKIPSQTLSDAQETANDQVAALTVNALIQAKLIPAAKENEVKRKLAAGTAKAEDWKLWIETIKSEG